MTIELIGGFETTYMPGHDRDVAETTQHDVRWRDDLTLLRSHGVERLRYPIRWQRVEEDEGDYDWRETDEIFGHMHDQGLRPIVDLVHHTSYPRWLTDGFADPRFRDGYLRFVEAAARRYSWIPEYTLFNEPFSTLFLAGHEKIWPPYHEGVEGFVGLIRNVLPAVVEASEMYRDVLPEARHVWVDTCEHHHGDSLYAPYANDRRFFVLDLFLGEIDLDSRFVPDVLAARGGDLFAMRPGHVDVVGLDYYAHCQWDFDLGGGGTVPTVTPTPLHEQIREYWERYDRPCMLTETNIRGFASDRASWFKYTLEQCELAEAAGVPVEGHCWFPFVDSADWDSLLFRCEGNIDPVGVHWLDETLDRRDSSMSRSFGMAAQGAAASELPAYRFREPVAAWLQGYLPQMAHWDWKEPPADEVCSNTTPPDARMELRIVDADATA